VATREDRKPRASGLSTAGPAGCVALLVVLCLLGIVAVPVVAAEATVLAPTWVRLFGGAGADQGWGIDIGPNGEVYLAGFVQGQGNDVFLARLDSAGNPIWTTTWNRPFSQKAFEIKYTDGFLYVGGVTQRDLTVRSQDMLLLKAWAENGTVAWDATWNGPADEYDEIDGIVLEDDLVYVSGWADVRTDYTAGDLALVKFTADGSYVAHALWGGLGREEGNGAMGSDGRNLYVTGVTDAINLVQGGDAVIAAFNQTTLTEVWNRTWGGTSVDDGFGLTLVNDRLYVTGITLSFGGDQIFLLEYDTEGNAILNATWGGSGSESARAIAVDRDDGSIYVAGKTTSVGNGSFDSLLLRYDPSGSLANESTWGGTGSDAAHGMAVEGNAIYIVGETTSQGQGGSDIFLLRVGSSGGTLPRSPPPGGLSPAVLGIVIGTVSFAVIVAVLLVLRRRRPPR